MEDRRNHRPVEETERLHRALSPSRLIDRLRMPWSNFVKIRLLFLVMCGLLFWRYGFARGTVSVMLVAGLMLLVPWFLTSLTAVLRPGVTDPQGKRRAQIRLVASALILVSVASIAWFQVPRQYIYISTAIGLMFFLLHALTRPWLRRLTEPSE